VLPLSGGLEVIQVFVPAGSFLMGSVQGDPLASSDEFPQRTVTVDAFWLDQTEVTNTHFAAFLNEEGNQEEGGVTWLELLSSYVLIESPDGVFQPKAGFEDHPVIGVSWYGARAYCEWIGGRLPTEAEWEYAARGPDSLIYPWGSEAPGCDLANHSGCIGRTAEVGSYPAGASPFGALDLAGNVWEWTGDSAAGPARVLRGGAWDGDDRGLRAAHRYDVDDPSYHDSYVGFRCAQQSVE
jgi:formylglycine-generating enzyme required for sulfatase activity